MDLKATIAKGYRNRLILIALGALLYAAWCLYDALVGYPDGQRAREAFEQVQLEHPEDWKSQWPAVADENGWDGTREPEEVSDMNIMTQWLQFAIVFPIGAYCLYSLAMWSRRYIGADDAKLYASGGVEVPYEKVVRVDAARWASKGIARVAYDLGHGEQDLIIDDWKYEREPSDGVYERLRQHVDADRFDGLGGADEPSDPQDPAPGASGDDSPQASTGQGKQAQSV